MLGREAHLNLVESSRRLFELDPEAVLDAGRGWLFGTGRSTLPAVANAAFRIDDELDPGELIEAARAFFAARERGFTLWARVGASADDDLVAAAEAGGLQRVYEMPEMVLGTPVETPPLADGVALHRVASAADAEDYWRVAGESYVSLGFPPDTFEFYEDHQGLWAENVAAFLIRDGGRPLAIAMTIVSHGIAGIYWVGTIAEARGKGLASAVTAAAVAAGFEMGATAASLQASPMGESVYRAMGFETIFDYRLYLGPAPQEGG